MNNKPPAQEKTKILHRLRRLEGQMRGLQKMIEEERNCHEILTLFASVRSALDSTADVVLETYLKECQQNFLAGEIPTDDVIKAVKLVRG